MNTELILKLQSWVDGELPDGEARRVAELVRTDTEAAALAAELKTTRGFLVGNEPEVKLPESRDFYWSKVRRAIEQAEAAATPERIPWTVAFRRLLVPVTGFALVAFLTVLSIGVLQKQGDDPLGQLIEVENLSEGVDSISYKSQAENMFVVYVFNKDGAASDEADDDWDLETDDSVIQ